MTRDFWEDCMLEMVQQSTVPDQWKWKAVHGLQELRLVVARDHAHAGG
jgi:hypothetical protein